MSLNSHLTTLKKPGKKKDMTQYTSEKLDEDEDDGTMPENVAELETAVMGHKIVKAEKQSIQLEYHYRAEDALTLTLDNGKRVNLVNTNDCCAYTELESFLLNPEMVDHIITGVGTTNGYTVWHIFADTGDIMSLNVGWSAGNPFYYGYGFEIRVEDVEA